jgi:hypothetical protein
MNKSEIIDFFIGSIATIIIISLLAACVICGLFEIIQQI